jgi:hypothetical protein
MKIAWPTTTLADKMKYPLTAFKTKNVRKLYSNELFVEMMGNFFNN